MDDVAAGWCWWVGIRCPSGRRLCDGGLDGGAVGGTEVLHAMVVGCLSHRRWLAGPLARAAASLRRPGFDACCDAGADDYRRVRGSSVLRRPGVVLVARDRGTRG